MKKLLLAGLFVFSIWRVPAQACNQPLAACFQGVEGGFALIAEGRPADVVVEATADPAVQHAAESFAADLQRVGGQPARRIADMHQARGSVVIVGVLGQSALIDQLVKARKLAVADLAGQWEGYRQIVIDQPVPGIERALIVVGSDRRGAVFGLYDLSEKIGVSPWHWFADVPVRLQRNVYLVGGSAGDHPRVKYRGFFINDEEPAFGDWAKQNFGGYNARMYAHVFELLLRLKGNTLWPAMWPPKAFNDDDPQNIVLADAMGVVMGTSHHEPMTRAHDEWHRHTEQGVTGGKWDYGSNAAHLRTFWRGGIERMVSKGHGQAYDSLVTVGMRGDGDEAMQEGTATQLLETIVSDQRAIIADVTGRPARETPQVWALYKEVQDYYDHGMRVPDDVILLFADDNWGQIRRLPTDDKPRAGGYGVYYHFDYVGLPRNYKWLNTNQNEKTWQQMDLAYARGARALWMVNVGDIKPMEFPLSFFLRQAWNPEAMTVEAMAAFPRDWAGAQFGAEAGPAIGALLTRYSQYAARRKPELIDADSFPLGATDGRPRDGDALDGGEFAARVAEWDTLEQDLLKVRAGLRDEQLPAYFQLVEHPIRALANLHRLYYAVAWNRRLAAQGDPRANAFADRAEAAFQRDAELKAEYHAIGDGKWNGMMAQTHIGYSGWQQPDHDVMPLVRRVAAQGTAPIEVEFASALDRTSSVGNGVDAPLVIEAAKFARAIPAAGLQWQVVPNLGHSSDAVISLPQGQPPTRQQDGMRLEYDLELAGAGDLHVQLLLVPTLDVSGAGEQRIGVSIDQGPMSVLGSRLVPAPTEATTQEQRDWNRTVEDNLRRLQLTLPEVSAGPHTLKIWRLDDNLPVQTLVVSRQPLPASHPRPASQAVRE
ncbi:glycosyl hydrolase 115 family protein [Pseudoxanthomonas indica]|uniref:Glycosyl hydrolase family 115 n=1 Tax=Pseudoxanthomonas indica TaxID=428993 RepID=A0A1T5K919_9GAMM|nr:glycosyl hydrolase 115 family protein [Pseudoxanthomonas indica]GGD47538.1 hypothetical protein GCM10007235_19310 [Pseudoxanthomonas indica]SKC60015.1 Glycosyl hydrolase family 115 [Pseudoxanthomonas indica]